MFMKYRIRELLINSINNLLSVKEDPRELGDALSQEVLDMSSPERSDALVTALKTLKESRSLDFLKDD
jgi:hypothetical protein